MKFYLRQLKNDFVQSNMTVRTINDNYFNLSWFKGQQVVGIESGQPELIYPDQPTVTENINVDKILTEKKTNLPLNNPHQIIACGVSEENGNFVFVDVLKYTYNTKSTTGYFKNASGILNPVLYILVPFADATVNDVTFIAVTNSLKVDNVEISDTFDFDITKTLADISDEYLPGISLSKDGTTITAQLKNADGTPAAKENVDIYFETTTGYLTKSRSTTNSSGVATTELINADSGKVKAGFKYFSGKTQIII
jgi:hypothetical protein